MKIALGSDRRGFEYKEKLIHHLELNDIQIIDVGPFDNNYPYDYAVYGEKVGKAIISKKADFGVVICGTGIGISIAANKVDGIRCGMGYTDAVAKQMREHIDANVIAFGQDEMDYVDVERRLDVFIKTPFLGGYHVSRLEQLQNIECGKPIEQTMVVNHDWKK